MIIKVCGMRETENVAQVASLGIDFMGFIFVQKSPRYVAGNVPATSGKVKRVGVFRDNPIDEVLNAIKSHRLDYVQLHGHESVDYARNITGARVIKVFNIASESDLAQCDAYHGIVDYFLFDTKCPTGGGSGKKFSWDVLDAYHGETGFILSGGIAPGDEDAILAIDHPQFVGIDLNSRFEIEPSIKDVEKLDDFITYIRQNEQDK